MWVSWDVLRWSSVLETARALFQGKDLLGDFGYAITQITPCPIAHAYGKARVIEVQLGLQLVFHGLETVEMSDPAHHVLTSMAQKFRNPRIIGRVSIVIHKIDRLKKPQPNHDTVCKNFGLPVTGVTGKPVPA
jgi:hypothetical protein